MDKQIYAIDRIEGDIAILESIITKEKIEVNIKELPNNINEGNILECVNNNYKLSISKENERRQAILEKFKKLRKDHN